MQALKIINASKHTVLSRVADNFTLNVLPPGGTEVIRFYNASQVLSIPNNIHVG